MDENKEANSKSQIKIGTILGYVAFAISILSGLFLTPFIIKTIGNSAYGIYTLSNSIIALFLLDFGLSTTTNVFLSKYKANNNKKQAEKFLNTVFKVYLIIALAILLVFIVAYFLVDYIYPGLSTSEKADLKVCLLITGLFSVISFPFTPFTGVLNADERYIFLKSVEILDKVLILGLSFIILKCGFGLYGLVFVHVIVGVICVTLRVFFCFKFLKTKIKIKEKASNNLRLIITYSIWTAIISIFSRLIFNVTPSILGIVSNSTEIAIFGIISTIEGYVFTFGSIMTVFFLPKIARIMETENYLDKLQKFAITVGEIQFLITSLIVFGFASCGDSFILLWVKNPVYEKAYLCILLICAHQLISIPQIIYQNSLLLVGKVKALAIISVVKAALNLGLSFLLSYYFGALGASIAISIARLFELIANNFLYKSALKISLWEFYKSSILSCILIAAIPFAVCATLRNFLKFSNLINFLMYGSIFVAVFFVLLFVVKRNKIKYWITSFIKR